MTRGPPRFRRSAGEDIVETYTAHLSRGVSASGGLQYIDHPAYNRDRGPVSSGCSDCTWSSDYAEGHDGSCPFEKPTARRHICPNIK